MAQPGQSIGARNNRRQSAAAKGPPAARPTPARPMLVLNKNCSETPLKIFSTAIGHYENPSPAVLCQLSPATDKPSHALSPALCQEET
jgi:hypothetical protein